MMVARLPLNRIVSLLRPCARKTSFFRLSAFHSAPCSDVSMIDFKSNANHITIEDTLTKKDVENLELGPKSARERFGEENVSAANLLKGILVEDQEALKITNLVMLHTKNPLIQNFIKVSSSVRDNGINNHANARNFDELSLKLSQADEDAVRSFCDFLPESHRQLSNEELKGCILSLGFWPISWILQPKDENVDNIKELLNNIYKRLETASFDRMYLFGAAEQVEDKENYMFKQSQRLDLAKAWFYCTCQASFHGEYNCTRYISRNFTGWSFPAGFINKGGNTTGTHGLFKDMSPKEMLEVATIVFRLKSLNEKFYRYYFIYKFFEFVDILDVDGIAVVCRTFLKHNIYLNFIHPIASRLTSKILTVLKDNPESITEENFKHINSYLRENGFVINEEARVAIEAIQQRHTKGLSLSTLIGVASLGNGNRKDFNVRPQTALLSEIRSQLVPALFQREKLRNKELICLTELIESDYLVLNDEEKTFLLSSIAEQSLTEPNVKSSLCDRLCLLFRLTNLGFYEQNVLERTFKDPRLVRPSKNNPDKFELNYEFVFRSDSKLHDYQRRLFCLIHGILIMKKGPEPFSFLETKGVNQCYKWLDVGLPSECKYNDKKPKSFTDMGLSLKRSLADYVARHQTSTENQVFLLEESLLPFLGTIEYLVVYDRKAGSFVPIPQEILDKEKEAIKLPTSKDYDWLVISLVDTRKHISFGRKVNVGENRPLPFVMLERAGYRVVGAVDITSAKSINGTREEIIDFMAAEVYQCLDKYLSTLVDNG